MRQGLLLALFVPCILMSAEITVTDSDITAPNTVQFTADNTYILDGIVIVDSGATLEIGAGTVIKANPGAALVVARHGTINAVGSQASPIVFTAVSDDGSLTMEDNGLWGGIIILGNAPVVTGDDGGIAGLPSGEAKAVYGGTDATDNSGVMQYVSIRHAGQAIEEDSPMAGLVFAGVGNGTTVDYIEVAAAGHNGIEFHGGSVACKHLVSVFTGENNYSFSESWNGKGQFWFSLENFDTTDYDNVTALHRGTGDSDTEDGPVFANVTYLGDGQVDGTVIRSHHGVFFRNNSAAKYHNCLFEDYTGKALCIEDAQQPDSLDSRKRMESGDLILSGCIFYSFGKNDEPDSNFVFMWDTLVDNETQTIFKTQQYAFNAMDEDPVESDYIAIQDSLRGGWSSFAAASTGIFRISREFNDGASLNPAVHPQSQAFEKDYFPLSEVNDPWFDAVDYRGAFSSDSNDIWLDGWTCLSASGLRPTAIYRNSQRADAIMGQRMNKMVRRSNNTLSIAIPPAIRSGFKTYITDSRGRRCALPSRASSHHDGRHLVFPLDEFSRGVYFCRIESGTRNITIPLVVR